MNPGVASILWAGLWTLVYVALHVACFRWSARFRKWSTLNRLYFALLPLVVISAWLVQAHLVVSEPTPAWAEVLAGVTLLVLLHNGYLMFYSINDRSLSVRMMVEFYRAQNRPLTLAELETEYDTRASYYRRLEILTEAGFVVLEQGRYRLTPRGAQLARAVRWLKEFYGAGSGG